MDYEFLKEYEERENEAYLKEKDLVKRFKNLKTPIFNRNTSNISIWSQITFSGTLIFPLHPLPQNVFETEHGIKSTQFPELIQFVKDMNKVQFVLTDAPTKYVKYDYLEPLLKEFEPPIYYLSGGFNQEFYKLFLKCKDEIKYLIQYSPEWRFLTFTTSGLSIIEECIRSYAYLRFYGFNEVADIFIENILSDPDFARTYISISFDLLVHPIIDPFKANPFFDKNIIEKANQMGIKSHISLNNAVFPEIGSYLIKKCTYYPESLEACKNVISQYEDNDLYKVYSALNNAVIDRNDSLIFQKKVEMEEILDDIWNDKRIQSNSKAYKYGINMICGTIGYCLGGELGLLGALGVNIIDNLESSYLDKFSELISKKTVSPYMVSIYDFKRKYGK